MAMYDGLDLSRFKKVSSDGKTTVLRHKSGHELRVAASALTPKMREHLESMGEDEDRQKFAGGGQAKAKVPVVTDKEVAIDPVSPAPATDQPAVAAPPPQPATAPASPEAMPAQAPAQKPIYQPINADELKAQDAAWQHDLDNGHVQPKTYADLYGKQDTLGKIGTLFGLLIGGAGAGLSHSPNAVAEMMSNEITRDFEAQKKSKENAQTFLNLNRQMLVDQATIGKMKQEGLVNEAQAKVMLQDANTKAYTLSRMQANRTALHSLVMQVNKMPVGSPERAAAEQKLALLANGIQAENYDLADRAAAAGALGQMAFGSNQEGDEGKFQQGQGVLRMSGNAPMAEDRAARHFPGIEGSASIPLSGGDRDNINSGLAFQDQMQRFIDWTKKHSGDLSPTDRKTGESMAAQLQGAYRLATKGGVYKEGEQGFISNIIDSTPTKFFNSIRVIPSLTAVQKESGAQLDQLLKSKGFKGYKGAKSEQAVASQPKEGTTGKFQGKPVIWQGGGWKYK